MRLANAFLANFAEVRGGIANVLGAYPEWWDVYGVPAPALMHLVAIVELEEEDKGHSFHFDFKIRRPGLDELENIGNVDAMRMRGPEDIIGAPVRNIIVFPAPVILGGVGLHHIVVSSRDDDRQSIEIPIWVRIVPRPGPPPASGAAPN